MPVPLKITFRNFPSSEGVAEYIRKRTEKLEHFAGEVLDCSVVVDLPHQHHHKNKIYHVRVSIGMRGREIVVGREPSRDESHADLYIAVRDAFDAAERLVKESIRLRREHHKRWHETAPEATPVNY